MGLITMLKGIKTWTEKAFAQVIIAAIMSFMIVAILLAVMLPVLNGIITATPVVTGAMNATQVSLGTTIASSYGLLVIVLLLLAALAIIVVIGLFQYFVGGMGGRQ